MDHNRPRFCRSLGANQEGVVAAAMKALQEATMKVPRSMMLGAPECLLMNQTLIKTKNAKKVIDIGMFTGASALAAALALGPEGKVNTFDVSDAHLELAKKHWQMAGVEERIQFKACLKA